MFKKIDFDSNFNLGSKRNISYCFIISYVSDFFARGPPNNNKQQLSDAYLEPEP